MCVSVCAATTVCTWCAFLLTIGNEHTDASDADLLEVKVRAVHILQHYKKVAKLLANGEKHTIHRQAPSTRHLHENTLQTKHAHIVGEGNVALAHKHEYASCTHAHTHRHSQTRAQTRTHSHTRHAHVHYIPAQTHTRTHTRTHSHTRAIPAESCSQTWGSWRRRCRTGAARSSRTRSRTPACANASTSKTKKHRMSVRVYYMCNRVLCSCARCVRARVRTEGAGLS